LPLFAQILGRWGRRPT